MIKELTNGQRRAIEALMLTNTTARAAQKAKVSEKSIYVWMKQDHFQTALRKARRNALAHTTTRLQQITARAVDTLEAVMEWDVRSASLGFLPGDGKLGNEGVWTLNPTTAVPLGRKVGWSDKWQRPTISQARPRETSGYLQ